VPERLLAIEQATVAFGEGAARQKALNNISLAFEAGTLTIVMGPSGSGKTTLLSVLGCMLKCDSGATYVANTEVEKLSETRRTEIRREHIGFIFQSFRLFRALSAEDNVALAAEMGRVPVPDGRAKAVALLAALGLEGKLHLTPSEFSGGEKQRVAVARALVRNPPVVLADEPTASLDTRAMGQIGEILRGLATQEGRVVVVSSHDPRWQEFAHRIVLLRDGEAIEDRVNAK
jgi:putative ABC transport system ATP-binding protein